MVVVVSYAVFETNIGWLGVVATEKGLARLILPHSSSHEVLEELKNSVASGTSSVPAFQDLIGRLRLYFSGRHVDFPDKLDLSAGTTFQQNVWRTTRGILYGETKSYTWVAEQVGSPRAMRAAGQTLGRNPLPIIIPCHRVVARDGGLGGYTGGLDFKRYLLRLESAPTA